ncbi:uncharacterized protein LOC144574088 isoform X4 [Carex rostrata]
MAVAAAVTPRLISRCPFPSFRKPQSSLDNTISISRNNYYCRTTVLPPPRAVVSTGSGEVQMSDPELRLVLELASDNELLEIESILFGTSYFSPLLKSISKRPDSYCLMNLDDMEEREMFISHLESRFLFLAADARSVIRGWRPSYRSVLLGVRKRLGVHCSSKLGTEDLELEIFIHLLSEYSSQKSNSSSLETGLSKWKVLRNAALNIGAEGLKKIFLKWCINCGEDKRNAKRLSGKLMVEAANYEIKKELIKRRGDETFAWRENLGMDKRLTLHASALFYH